MTRLSGLKRTSLFSIILASSLLIQACATLDANECVTADWYALGQADGSKGKSFNRLDKHRKACAKHGITPKAEAYETGYDKGIRRYCTPQRAYKLGKINKAIPDTCPNDLLDKLSKAHNYGLDIYAKTWPIQQEISLLNKDLKVTNRDINKLTNERSEHKKYLKLADEGLNDKNIKKLERIKLYTQKQRMRDLIADTNANIDELEYQKQQIENQIDNRQAAIHRLNATTLPPLAR